MKKKSTSQSAFFNLRLLIGAVFCLGGLAVVLLGAGVFATAKDAKQSNRGQRVALAPTNAPFFFVSTLDLTQLFR